MTSDTMKPQSLQAFCKCQLLHLLFTLQAKTEFTTFILERGQTSQDHTQCSTYAWIRFHALTHTHTHTYSRPAPYIAALTAPVLWLTVMLYGSTAERASLTGTKHHTNLKGHFDDPQ